MANTFDVADWLCMEGVRRLNNTLVVGQFFNTDWEENYEKEFAVGDTVRVPIPLEFSVTDGLAYQPQPIQDTHTTITVDQISGVHFEYDAVERALRMPRGEDRVTEKLLVPAMDAIKQDIDSRCANWAYQNTNNIVGVLGTDPTTFDAVFGAAKQRMTELACPQTSKRAMILWPKVARALRASAVTYFNPPDEFSRQWKKGIIGEKDGFDTYESMSLYSHTSGVWAGVVEMLAGGQSGASLSLTATTSDTFKAGDVFNIVGVNQVNIKTKRSTGTLAQFRIIADVTAAASAATILIDPPIIGPGSPYQNVDALPAAGADLTLFPGTAAPTTAHSGTQSLALTRDAFALVGVTMKNPSKSSVEMVSQARDPNTGISVAFLRDHDSKTRTWINRFDVLWGRGNLRNNQCSVRVLSA